MAKYTIVGADGKRYTVEAGDESAALELVDDILGRGGAQELDPKLAYPETFTPHLQNVPIDPTAPISGPLPTPGTMLPPKADPLPGAPEAPIHETKRGDVSPPVRGPGAVTIPGLRALPGETIPLGTPPPPDTLAGPGPAPQESYWILPYPGAPNRVRSRLTQEQWDRQRLVRQLASRLSRRPGAPGSAEVAANAALLNLIPQLGGASGALGEGLARWLRPERADLESQVGLPEAYSLYRDAYRHLYQEYGRENYWSNLLASLAGGFGGIRPGSVRGLVRSAPSSTARDLGIASTTGAGFGAISGAAETPETWESTGRGALEGALGGAVLGPAAYGALRGIGSAATRYRQWRDRRRAEATEQARMQDTTWQELGVEPPPVATLTGRPRQVAEFLATTPWGSTLRSSTSSGLARLEQSLTEALRFGGAPRTMTSAGEEAQALISRALRAGRTPEEVARMSLEELQAISGVESMTFPGQMPSTRSEIGPRVQQVTREDLLRERGLPIISEEEAAAAARSAIPDVEPTLPTSQPIARPPIDPQGVSPEAIREISLARTRLLDAEVAERSATEALARARHAVREYGVPFYRSGRVSRPVQGRYGIGYEGRFGILDYLADLAGDPRAIIQAYRDRKILGQLEALSQRLGLRARGISVDQVVDSYTAYRQSLAALEDATRSVAARRQEISIAETSAAQEAAQRGRVAQQAEYDRLLAQQQMEQTTEIARRRQEGVERVSRLRSEAEAAARARHRQESRGLRIEAAERTRHRQAISDADFRRNRREQALQESPTSQARPSGLPRSIESYPTQIAAGEQALSQMAPPVQGRLLDRNNPTAFAKVLGDLALEARSGLRARGYRPENLFDPETGRIHAGVRVFLAEEMGIRSGQAIDGLEGRPVSPAQQFIRLLDALASQRFSSEFPSGLRGLSRIIDQLQALRGQRGVNSGIIDRIVTALRTDLRSFAGRSSEGQHWLRETEILERIKARVEQELVGPLRVVADTGNPAAAMQILQQSMRPGGDLRMLRAFLQVAEEKGSRNSAVSMLLTGLTDDGLQGFVRNWRNLTPEARALIFQGQDSALGARLDRFAQAVGHVGDFPTSWRLRDIPRARNILQGLIVYLHLRPALSAVLPPGTMIGTQMTLDRLLASPRFRNWMLRVPLEAGPRSEQWRRHLGLLSGVVSQASGLDPAMGRQVISTIMSLLSSAQAQEGERATTRPLSRKGSVQTEEAPEPTDIRSLPYWHRAHRGADQSIFHYDMASMQPDQEIFAGRPRAERRPTASATLPSWTDIITPAMQRALSRTTWDRMRRVSEFSPMEGAFQGGRLVAHGVDQADLGSLLMGGLSIAGAAPIGMGIVIGLPGARRLAYAGHGNAQTMINFAEQMRARGMPWNSIQHAVSRRLEILGDTQLGTVVEIPGGRIGIELVSSPDRFTPMFRHEVRPLRDVRPDQSLLYTAHPELRGLDVWYYPELGETTGLAGLAGRRQMILENSPNRMGTGRIMEHELQHYVSQGSGFPGGATPQLYEPGGLLRHLLPPGMSSRQAYYNTTDEWLARQAAERMFMPADELRAAPLTVPEGMISWFPEDLVAGTTRAAPGMARPASWTQERLQQAADLLQQGMSRAEVASQLGVSRISLDRALQRYGQTVGVEVPRAEARYIWTNHPERIDELQQLWGQRLSRREIAERMGLTEEQVQSGLGLLRTRTGTVGTLPRRNPLSAIEATSGHVDALLNSARRLQELGYGANRIGEILNLRPVFVARLLGSHLPRRRGPPSALGEADIQELVRLRKEGMQITELASRFSMSRSYIEQLLQNAGATRPHRLVVGREKEIRDLFAANRSSRQIAEELGVSVSSINRVLRLGGRRSRRGSQSSRAVHTVNPEAKRIFDLEESLRAEGKTPEQIAREINLRFKEGVTAEEIRSGNVWWRMEAE